MTALRYMRKPILALYRCFATTEPWSQSSVLDKVDVSTTPEGLETGLLYVAKLLTRRLITQRQRLIGLIESQFEDQSGSLARLVGMQPQLV